MPFERSSTIIGMSPPPGIGDPSQPPPAPPPAGGPTGFARTVMGLAPVPPAAPAPLSTAGDIPTQRGPEPVTGGGPLVPPTKTILGVARPGIAPLNPGVAKTPIPEAFPLPPPPPADAEAPLESEPTEPPRRRTPLLAGLVLGAAVVLLAGAGAALYWLRGPGPIEAKAGLNAQNQEQLLLSCPSCKDGTAVSIGSQRATLRGGRAELPLSSGLKVGENRFELDVIPAGKSRASRVSLNVPLEYRVRGDTSTLTQTPPRLSVQIEAIPGSKVSVEDQPLTLDASSRVSHQIDLSKELSGPDVTVRKLERRVPYVITPPAGAPQRGEVLFQLGVIPLTLDAPGESITIEGATFVLSGRTLKGSSVDVAGRPLPVDAEGRFEQTMSVSAAGETTVAVRAIAPDYAPRTVTFRVRRVNSLAEAGRAERARAITSYGTVAADIEQHRGKLVAFDGSVSEIGSVAPSTLFLLDAKSGCPKAPCIAKVVYGGRLKLALGERVSVFGLVRAAVAGPRPGTQVPEVAAEFVVKSGR